MTSVLESIQQRSGTPDERARILRMADADAKEVIDALSPDTRRTTFCELFEEPGTASELAERLDTSVQNAHYHLTTLEEVGLVEAVDTVYSAKGNEMTVYGPASDPIVFVGDDDRVAPVRRSLSNVIGGLSLLAVASLLVQAGAEGFRRTGTTAASDVGPTSTAPADSTASETVLWVVFEVLEPGLLFFVGCLAIAGLLAWRARQ